VVQNDNVQIQIFENVRNAITRLSVYRFRTRLSVYRFRWNLSARIPLHPRHVRHDVVAMATAVA